MLEDRELFHVGIVVAELEAALAAITQVAGTQWGPIRSATMETETGDGHTGNTSLRYVFSEGARMVELVEAVPGTLWEPVPRGVHHVGYWSDAIDDDSARLQRSGVELALRGRREGTTSWMFAYHRTADGLVELVDSSRRAALAAATGSA